MSDEAIKSEQITLEHLVRDFYQSHTSMYRGYVSTKSAGVIKKYKGRFGEGYVVYTNNRSSSYYCFITYFLTKN